MLLSFFIGEFRHINNIPIHIVASDVFSGNISANHLIVGSRCCTRMKYRRCQLRNIDWCCVNGILNNSNFFINMRMTNMCCRRWCCLSRETLPLFCEELACRRMSIGVFLALVFLPVPTLERRETPLPRPMMPTMVWYLWCAFLCVRGILCESKYFGARNAVVFMTSVPQTKRTRFLSQNYPN